MNTEKRYNDTLVTRISKNKVVILLQLIEMNISHL